MAPKRFQGVIEVKESRPVSLKFLLCQDSLVDVLLAESFKVVLQDCHANFSAVVVLVKQTFSDHPPVVVGIDDFGDLIEDRVQLIQYSEAFPESEVFLPLILEERSV